MWKKRRKTVSTTGAPRAIGPYSQAVTAGGFIFCSGQIPLDPGSGGLVAGDVKVQTRRVLDSLQAILKAARSGLDRVVKTTVFLKDMDHFNDMNEAYAEFFPADPPARATVEVSRLPKNVLVEIDCVALAP